MESYYFALKHAAQEKRIGGTEKNQGKGRLRAKSESEVLLLIFLNVKCLIFTYEEYKMLGYKF